MAPDKIDFQIIRSAIATPDHHLPLIELRVERLTLAKRRWRGVATDGTEFGFDLEHPLEHGEVFLQNRTNRYLIMQLPEKLLRVAMPKARQAAALAWQIGNLHFRLMIEEGFVLVEDDPALRQMFDRGNTDFTETLAIFRPMAGIGHHHH